MKALIKSISKHTLSNRLLDQIALNEAALELLRPSLGANDNFKRACEIPKQVRDFLQIQDNL